MVELYHRQSRKGKPIYAVSAPCPRCLTTRRAGCSYVPVAQQGEQQLIEAASRRFKSVPEHQFAADPVGGASLTHGPIPTFGWRVREKGSFLPFLVEPPHAVGGHRIHKPVSGFSGRMCVRFTGMETYRLLYDRLSAIWSAAHVCRHGWFDSKGGFLCL